MPAYHNSKPTIIETLISSIQSTVHLSSCRLGNSTRIKYAQEIIEVYRTSEFSDLALPGFGWRLK